VLRDAFETDFVQTKIKKFMKDDPDDFLKTQEVLRKYYVPLKDQFICSVADPTSYPNANWINFVKICGTEGWNLIDNKKGTLLKADVDRIFIAVNYEEEDLS
jgi:hypothetical protein